MISRRLKWLVFWALLVVAIVYLARSGWFDKPHVQVTGAPGSGPPSVDPELQQVDVAALQAAAEYAGQHKSRALLVSRNSHIVFEKYWDGAAAHRHESSGTFNEPLTFVMLAIALGEAKVGSVEEPASNYIKAWGSEPRGQTLIRKLEPAALVRVIESATGVQYPQLISEKLWKRIGAQNAALSIESGKGEGASYCCLLAVPLDWMRLAEVLANDGVYMGSEILRPGAVNEMLAVAAGQEKSGWRLARSAPGQEEYNVRDMFVLDGGRQKLWVSPSLRLSILEIGGDALSEARIPNLIIQGLRDYVPPAAAPSRTIDPSQYAPGH